VTHYTSERVRLRSESPRLFIPDDCDNHGQHKHNHLAASVCAASPSISFTTCNVPKLHGGLRFAPALPIAQLYSRNLFLGIVRFVYIDVDVLIFLPHSVAFKRLHRLFIVGAEQSVFRLGYCYLQTGMIAQRAPGHCWKSGSPYLPGFAAALRVRNRVVAQLLPRSSDFACNVRDGIWPSGSYLER
jgi:hypothetical protein